MDVSWKLAISIFYDKYYALINNIGFYERKIGLHHTVMIQEAYYYVRNNIKQIIIHENEFTCR